MTPLWASVLAPLQQAGKLTDEDGQLYVRSVRGVRLCLQFCTLVAVCV